MDPPPREVSASTATKLDAPLQNVHSCTTRRSERTDCCFNNCDLQGVLRRRRSSMSHSLDCRLNRPWESAADHNLFQAP